MLVTRYCALLGSLFFIMYSLFVVATSFHNGAIPHTGLGADIIQRDVSVVSLNVHRTKERIRLGLNGLLYRSNRTDDLDDVVPLNISEKLKVHVYESGKVCGNLTRNLREQLSSLPTRSARYIDSDTLGHRVFPPLKSSMKDYIEKWKPHLDTHSYRYLYNPRNACLSSENITLLILVTTAPSNFALRSIIRHSWMRAADIVCLPTKTLFLLGEAADPYVQTLVSHEANFHRDMILEDFSDSYLNLSTKTVMAMKWAATFCSNAEFVMKTDDDVMLNIFI